MTFAEKLAALQKWERAIKDTDASIEALHLVTGMCDGPLIESIWRLQDVATDMTAWVVGDASDWLDWYRSENGMGAKGMKAGPEGNLREIKSLGDLLWLLEVAA